jgi:hypothetical protein
MIMLKFDSVFDLSNISNVNEIPGSQAGSH